MRRESARLAKTSPPTDGTAGEYAVGRARNGDCGFAPLCHANMDLGNVIEMAFRTFQ